MRKARHWLRANSGRRRADDFMKIANAFPSPENAWLRQVSGYWDMAATMVLHGALNEELFIEPGVQRRDVLSFSPRSNPS